MDLVIVILFVLCLCCLSSCIIPIIVLYYKANLNVQEWRCTDVGSDKYVVSRMNNFDAECMYDPKGVGCYIIKPDSFEGVVDKADLKQQCDNFIKNYPVVKPINYEPTTFNEYTCGENSINKRIWNLTGYENPNDMCYKIKNDRSVANEMKNISKTFLNKMKNVSKTFDINLF